MMPVMPALRLAALFVFCLAVASAAFFPPSSPVVRADSPIEAPETLEEAPSGPIAETHEEIAKHLGAWDFSHPLPALLAGIAGSGASPLETSIPPLFPPPPNRA